MANYSNQLDFSTLLFDTLFGLVLFFSFDSFLDIHTLPHLVIYLLCTLVLVHWWLIFKSSDDLFNTEVTNSAVDLIMGVIYIIFIDYIILYAKSFQLYPVVYFTCGLLFLDCVWAFIWRYIGVWKTTDKSKITSMERELDTTMFIDIIGLSFLVGLALIMKTLPPSGIVISYGIIYLSYIILTFKYKIIDIRIF